MTITTQTADGVMHQFPDGTPDAVIDNTMKNYATQTAQSQPGGSDTVASDPLATGGMINGAMAQPMPIPADMQALADARNARARAGRAATAGLSNGLFDVYRSLVDHPAAWLSRNVMSSPADEAASARDDAAAAQLNQAQGSGAIPAAMRIIGNTAGSAPFIFDPQIGGGYLAGAFKGALQGAEAGALTSAGNDGSLGTNVGTGAALGGAIPLIGRGLFNGIRALGGANAASDDSIAQAAASARQAGYVLPPNMASNNPGMISQALNGVAGKIKTQQLASVKNADVTNALAARSVGLPEDQPITEAALEQVRSNAGQAYNAVRQAPVQIIPDQQWASDIGAIDQRGAAARAEVPGLVKNPDLDDLNENLSKITQLSPDAAVDAIQSLRYQAKTNLKNYTSPEKLALGRAQSQAANAMEGLVERNLQAATTARAPIGAQGGDMSALVSQLQDARATIAKTYSVESALNPATGNVDAQKLAALQAKGTPLTGELKQAADTATAFPKAVQSPSKFGGNENVGVLDAAMSLGMEHAGGGPAALAWLAGRPAVRHLILSNMYQNMAIPAAAANAGAGAASGATLLNVPAIANNPILRNLLIQQALSAVQPARSPAGPGAP